MKKLLLLLCLALIKSTISNASNVKNTCFVTKEFWQAFQDNKNKTNKLIQINNPYAVFTGQLLDKNCVPISDAKITLWQTNNKVILSGEAITNTNGNFEFFIANKIGGALYLMVSHKDFMPFMTKIQISSKYQIEFKENTAFRIKDNAKQKYNFNIVMKTTSKYKSF